MKLITIAMFVTVLLISGFACPDRKYWEELYPKDKSR